MKSIEFLEAPNTSHQQIVSFIVFEPQSHRIDPEDILLQGEAVYELFNSVMLQVGRDSSLSEQILINRLTRIKMMLELVNSTENVILTRFMNTVWRRYAFFSNLGELFLTLDAYKSFVPSFKVDKKKSFIKRAVDPFDFEEMLKSSSDDEKEEEEKEEDKDKDKENVDTTD